MEQSSIRRRDCPIATLFEDKITQEFNRAKKGPCEDSALYWGLQRLDKHIKSVKTSTKHLKAWKVCVNSAYSIYDTYGVPLHYMSLKGKYTAMPCFFNDHDDTKMSSTKERD